MTSRPVPSIIDDQVSELIMPARADIAEQLKLPRETPVESLPYRMALTIKGGRKSLGVRREQQA